PALVAAARGGNVARADLGQLLDAGRRRVQRDAAAGVAKPDAVGVGYRVNNVAERGDGGPGGGEEDRPGVGGGDHDELRGGGLRDLKNGMSGSISPSDRELDIRALVPGDDRPRLEIHSYQAAARARTVDGQ